MEPEQTSTPAAPPEDGALDRLVARVPYQAWRLGGVVWFTVALTLRLRSARYYASGVLFALETAVPALILVAYVFRPPPVRTARGFAGVVLPFFAAGLPFGFLTQPFTAWGRAHLELFALLLTPPTALMVASYVTLNRSYALMAEARRLVTRGPYALVRHPVYVSQILCGGVVVAFRFSALNLVLYLVFIALQRARAAAEEAALAEAFPDSFAAYKSRTGRFWP